MKKRILLWTLVFACVVVFAAANGVSAEETSGTCGNNLTWDFDANTGTLTISGEGPMYDYTWSDAGESASGAPWGYLGYSVSNLVIEEGVTRIGDYAFYYAGLENGVAIPQSVTEIGEFAFAHSHAVQIDLPSGITHISKGAFSCCVWLEKVHIPEGVTVIGDSAFSACLAMMSIEIPDSVTTIGSHAFSHNDQFTSVTIPENVTSIGVGAFDYCYGLDAVHTTSLAAWCGISFGSRDANPLSYAGALYVNGELLTDLVIPDGTSDISVAAFAGAKCLTSVTIPKGVAGIGDYAFYECSNIQKVVISEGPATIGYRGFDGCTSLQEVVIHEGVTTIGGDAFRNCDNLTTIWLPASLLKIDEYAFYSVDLWHVMYAGTQDQWKAITFGAGNDTLTRAIRHTQCTGQEAVNAAEKICDVCPADLTYSCGEHILWSFDAATGTLTITGEGEMYDGLQNWDSFKYDIKTVVVEEGVTTIGKKAFFDIAVTSVSLPASLKKIGESAFEGCDELTELDIPEGVHTIDRRAFAGCDFSEVKLPTSLTKMSDELYAENKRITKVVIPAHIRVIGERVFSSTKVSLVEFVGDAPDISRLAFQYRTVSVVYPAGNATWTDVISQKFEGEVYWLPSGYSSPEEAFGTDSFTWRYENGTLYISGTGFMGGWKMTEEAPWRPLVGLVEHVVITGKPSNVYTRSFSNFSNLQTVSMPDCITDILYQAFTECVNLRQIDLPDSLQTIDQMAFSGCENLATLTIPKSVTMIVSRAFVNCGLKTVYFAGSMPNMGFESFTSPEMTIYYPSGNRTWKAAAIEELRGKAVHANTVFVADDSLSGGETDHSGSCGSNMTWKFNKGVLTLSGSGDMSVFQNDNSIPWAHLRGEITSVVVGDDITSISYLAFSECKNLKKVTLGNSLKYIGGQAFRGCSNLESIELPKNLEHIGDFAFYECKKLEVIVIPASVTWIDVQAFYSCKALNAVYFEGDAPFIDYSFLNVTATVYYPADNASWTAGVMKQYGGNLTWKPYCINTHSFSDWTTVQNPTEEAAGLEERICSQCGQVEQQPIPKLEPTQPPTDPSEPADQPSEPNDPATEPTQPSESKPSEPSAPTAEPTEPTEPKLDVEPLPVGTNPWVIVGIVLAAVLLLAGAAVIVLKRRKH